MQHLQRHIVNRVREAFAEIEYPGDRCITANPNIDFNVEETLPFVGKDWQTIDFGFLESSYDTLFLMTNEAFRYFLPAYIMVCIKGIDNTEQNDSLVGHTILSELSPPPKSDINAWTRFKERTDPFTQQQCEAIAGFLSLLRVYSDLYPAERVESALSYWGFRARKIQ